MPITVVAIFFFLISPHKMEKGGQKNEVSVPADILVNVHGIIHQQSFWISPPFSAVD